MSFIDFVEVFYWRTIVLGRLLFAAGFRAVVFVLGFVFFFCCRGTDIVFGWVFCLGRSRRFRIGCIFFVVGCRIVCCIRFFRGVWLEVRICRLYGVCNFEIYIKTSYIDVFF